MRLKRSAAIIAIICIALVAGILINFVWTLFEKITYPRKYSEFVEKYAEAYNVPEALIYATIKVESNFEPNAVSSAGAKGLMQIMPDTFLWLTGDEHLGEHLSVGDMLDPEVNIRYGVYYLKYLHAKFDRNVPVIAAAYNGGEGNVMKWLADKKYSDGEGGLKDYPDAFSETENYVAKINKTLEMYEKLYYKK